MQWIVYGMDGRADQARTAMQDRHQTARTMTVSVMIVNIYIY